MVTRLKDGTLCEIDDPNYSIVWWLIERTGGWNDGEVSDEKKLVISIIDQTRGLCAGFNVNYLEETTDE